MKVFSIIVAISTALTMISTMICGLWIKANAVTDASSLDFHKTIGIASVILGIIAMVLLIVLAVKK